MYKISGTNLFGQWLEEDKMITDFRVSSKRHNNYDFDINSAVLLQISWSYNIFLYKKAFYIIGGWNGLEGHMDKIELPAECETADFETNLTMVGNDYNIILVNKTSNTLWVIDLQKEKSITKIKLNIELPLHTAMKRARCDSQIQKVAVTNNSYLCLTTDGTVYNGIMPSLLDTNCCIGKVCDIRCGYEHFMLLTDVGRVYTWGNGRRLQLGHGTLDNLDTPTEVEALAGIKITKIGAGGWHCMALSEFGDLYTWGWNDTGQLGVRDTDSKGVLNREGLKSYPLPTLVDIQDENGDLVDMNVRDVDCGSRHSAIILEDFSVWTTGNNKYGQLGVSPQLHPTIKYFTKTFQCDDTTLVQCGHWSTILSYDKE